MLPTVPTILARFPTFFCEFFKVFFAPEPLKKAGFHGVILVIRDTWAMGLAGFSGFLVVARTSFRNHESAAAVKASR
jgi:hypothetical protein